MNAWDVDRMDLAIAAVGLAGPCTRKAVVAMLAEALRAGLSDHRVIAQALPAKKRP